MEPYFEIRMVNDRKILTEFYRNIGVGPRWPVVILLAAAMVFNVLFSYSWGVLEENAALLMIGTVVFAAVFFLPHYMVFVIIRSAKKNNGGVMPEMVVSVGDTIEVQEGMVHLTVEYQKLVRVVRLKRSYVLMLNRRGGLILDPACFTKGTFSDFKQFLRLKRPDLLIPE